MKKLRKRLGLIVGLLLLGSQTFAQTDNTPTFPPTPPKADDQVKFKLSGYAVMNYAIPEAGIGGFVKSTFAPIFTWRTSDKLFFQSEVEFASEDGAYDGAFEVEFATLNYLVNKHMTFYAGKFLGPVGTFQGRYHPAWINKSVSKPIGYGNKVAGLKRLAAGAEAGFGLKGGIQLGNAKMNYDIYLANGGILDPTNGELEMESLGDNNQNKAIGGRLGLLPFTNSSLEIGVSGYTGKVGEKGTEYENTKVALFAVDFNFVKSTGAGVFDIKAEFQQRTVDAGTVYYTNAADTLGYTFDNSPTTMYAQLAYRLPSVSGAEWLSKFELVGRYAAINVDKGPSASYIPAAGTAIQTASTYGATVSDITLGLNYWINFNTVLKIGYDIVTFDDDVMDAQPNNMLSIQAAMGF